MLERQKFEPARQDAGTRIANVSHARDRWLLEATVRNARDMWLLKSSVRWLRRLWTTSFSARKKRYLNSLSDRQLKDAGIDLTLAGRGKSAAARLDPNLEGLR